MEFHYHNYRYLSFYNIYIRYFFIVLIITRFVFPCFRNFKMFSSNHVPFMFSSLNMLGHIVFANNSTTLADNSSVSFSDFFLKNYEVICIINLKNTIFKGFTRGGAWAPPLVKQNLNRTQKYKGIAFKKK
jgi:hypothetical protein